MPLEIIRNDITKMEVCAIVNAANETLLGGGGVDGCIHKAAGKGLLEECQTLGGCQTGRAKVTGAYNLPCKYVIHTVGPVWEGGNYGEKELLISCYKESLAIAKEKKCESVAFPLISSGVFGYPKDKALKVAVDTIGEFLLENDMTVYIVIFDRASYSIGEKLFSDIKQFIDDNYVREYTDCAVERRRQTTLFRKKKLAASVSMPLREAEADLPFHKTYIDESFDNDLEHLIDCIDESFSQMLLRKIDEKKITDAECYKKANIDRKLFSKIRSDVNYKPSKQTAIAFAIALELPLEETKEMLCKAGFALSRSNKFDIIIEYFITKGNYNVFEINEALFAFDQHLLGA